MSVALYAAYGSNLHHDRMQDRCPGAEPVGSALLPGWRLVLGCYAAIQRDPQACVPVGIWRVTPDHIAALDVAEGTEHGIYERVTVEVPGHGEAWIYLERTPRRGPPEPCYVRHLQHGYDDFGLDPGPLEDALLEAGFAV